MNANGSVILKLEDVARRIRDLPTLPAVAMALLRDLDDDEMSLDSMTEKISMDHSIAAKLLRLANSSHFGSNSRVVTLQQALALLGVQNVKNVIRTTILKNSFPANSCPTFDFKGFWQHSVATAVCAELISRSLHMKHDFAFTAGLLHDLGRLVLVTCYPSAYAQVLAYRLNHDITTLDAETAIFGISHVEAGIALANAWHFSDSVRDAIRGHHQPEQDNLHPLAAVVHVANAITHALDLGGDEKEVLPQLSGVAWDSLGLQEADYLAIFRETEMRCDALNQILI